MKRIFCLECFPRTLWHEMERLPPLLSALLAMAIVGADCKGMCIESKAGHGARAHYGRCSWKPIVRLEPGLLRLRGGYASRKRQREPSWCHEDSAGHDDGSAAPKRARVGGLMSNALSASYSLAAMPFKVAYYLCAGVLAAPQAAVNYLLPRPAKRRLSEKEILRFEGDEDKPAAVKRQIAFYFSDSNLPFDSFLKGQMAKDSLGRVQLDVIASFKRMRILGASVQDLAEAARSVDFLEVGGWVRSPACQLPSCAHSNFIAARSVWCRHAC